ncbi:putative iron-regulated membrane protein [Sphingomonas sp. PP-CE-3G-477]|uniref:PepSY-associated TM helix domain-containing protein n=1 Tax=Sphingomonas sp. PP-CE-3G-477 TaxID=2135660 RepID=UPI000D37C789|nr:PepSY domain-containing protein [Sphingomonas sp. PP-CE-3G-477]PTQ64668.1 putative iron-regulated membrane protein [Sphingomonas sp. PP-CE-3G-477]
MASASSIDPKAYRAIWRWHFYAGLIVAPFLLILSITGAIYLFNDEIDDALYPSQRFVALHTTTVPPSRMIRAALTAYPGAATRIDLPGSADRSAVVYVTPDRGDPRRVAVDPGTGRVLGSTIYARTLVGFADAMHGSLTLGTIGDRVVELAACWALVLIATGLYLWWPRNRRGFAGILYPRLRAGGRLFWRDLHAVIGVWSVAFIAFLLLTGLPWAGIEGDLLNRGTAAIGIGYPASNRTHNAPTSVPMKTALGEAPWTMELAPMPSSAPSSEHAGHAGHEMAMAVRDDVAVSGIDRIANSVARQHGMTGAYRLFLPSGPTGVYTAYTYPDRPQGQRTLYFDRWTGSLISEVGYPDYGWAAKAIELGVQLHMGNYFGLVNQLVMLSICIAIVVLVVSGIVMWWKRRPAGRLAAPARVPSARIKGAIAILIAAGLAFPMLGVSTLAIFLLDRSILFARDRFGRTSSTPT